MTKMNFVPTHVERERERERERVAPKSVRGAQSASDDEILSQKGPREKDHVENLKEEMTETRSARRTRYSPTPTHEFCEKLG